MRHFPPEIPGRFRENCYACLRPKAHCLCGLIEPFAAHCRILILQHPHERRKYYNTARLVRGALTNSKLMRGLIFGEGEIESVLKGQSPYLLFPGPLALDAAEIELNEKSTVIVLDGTWSEAGKVLRRNPCLLTLPRVSFRSALRSNYKIRKQPKEHYLSTIESVAHLLKINAAANGQEYLTPRYDSLLEGFARMVERQLSFFPRFAARGELSRDAA